MVTESVPAASPAQAGPSDPAEGAAARTRRYRLIAGIVIALAAALILWLIVRDTGEETSGAASTATLVSESQLQELATSVGHPVFWLGPKAGTRYELVRLADGAIYVRYLPADAAVGSPDKYLTVATYPFPGAYAAIETVAKEQGVSTIKLNGGGIAEASATSSTSVHAAYPGLDYQVEVFDPTPGAATALIQSGHLTAFGKVDTSTRAAATAGKPTATTPARMRALADSLGYPIYWVGTKQGYTYELSRTRDGQILVRYLPPGKQVGASGSYLTIGTYPYPKALAAVRALGKSANTVVLELPGGGVGVIDKTRPQNVHLAYPKSNYQIEVFAPTATIAKRVVSSGQLKTIG